MPWRGSSQNNIRKTSKDASVLKWERKRPVVKMEGPEGFMNELVVLENTYAEIGAKTFKKRWAVFRPALEGRARESVEVELERRSLTAEKIAEFSEEQYKVLYEYMIGYLERSVGLTVEKKAEIALAVMTAVKMADSPSGAASANLPFSLPS